MAVVNRVHIQLWIPLQLASYTVTHNHPYISTCSTPQQVMLAATYVEIVMCDNVGCQPSLHLDFYEIFLLLACALFYDTFAVCCIDYMHMVYVYSLLHNKIASNGRKTLWSTFSFAKIEIAGAVPPKNSCLFMLVSCKLLQELSG